MLPWPWPESYSSRNNTGLPLFEDDRNAGPINDWRYTGNTFFGQLRLRQGPRPPYARRRLRRRSRLHRPHWAHPRYWAPYILVSFAAD